MPPSPRPFRYFADPVCIACLIIYPINRFYLKPHHIGGWFTHGYLNDVMCLPLFVPMILYVQRAIGLRNHDGYPRVWELFQHWVIFSIMFQAITPRFPKIYTSAGDPWDMLAYFAGGVIGWLIWSREERRSAERQEVRGLRAERKIRSAPFLSVLSPRPSVLARLRARAAA